ncbi:MAG: hypothetical protein ACW9W3_07280 [Candidatus Nitrosopumilus sp. bin_68KS]
MDLDSHIQHANKAIHNTKVVRETSRKILGRKLNVHPTYIRELSKTMQSVIISTDKAIKGAKLAESRAKSRLAAVKKATAKTIAHTKNAKYAAIASKKTANAALETSNKMKNPKYEKKYQEIFDAQIAGSIHVAKVAEIETEKALKASKTARIAARMALKEMQI